jgi:hypothetical protein
LNFPQQGVHSDVENVWNSLLDLADDPLGEHAARGRCRHLLDLRDHPAGATGLAHHLALVVGQLVELHELNGCIRGGLGAKHRHEAYADVATLIVEDLRVQAGIELGEDSLRGSERARP